MIERTGEVFKIFPFPDLNLPSQWKLVQTLQISQHSQTTSLLKSLLWDFWEIKPWKQKQIRCGVYLPVLQTGFEDSALAGSFVWLQYRILIIIDIIWFINQQHETSGNGGSKNANRFERQNRFDVELIRLSSRQFRRFSSFMKTLRQRRMFGIAVSNLDVFEWNVNIIPKLTMSYPFVAQKRLVKRFFQRILLFGWLERLKLTTLLTVKK